MFTVLSITDNRISIHALREEGDSRIIDFVKAHSNFYPRPPRGGRPPCVIDAAQSHLISIHALREEGDRALACMGSALSYFYPRPPRGGRLIDADVQSSLLGISIHALREEGDPPAGSVLWWL